MTSTLPGPIPPPHCHDTPAEFPGAPTVPRQVPVEPSQPQYEGRDSEANHNPVPLVSEPEPEPVRLCRLLVFPNKT